MRLRATCGGTSPRTACDGASPRAACSSLEVALGAWGIDGVALRATRGRALLLTMASKGATTAVPKVSGMFEMREAPVAVGGDDNVVHDLPVRAVRVADDIFSAWVTSSMLTAMA